MVTQPTFVIAGYYGFDNWGDEATLQVLVSRLRAAMPQARPIVLSNAPAATASLHQVEAINRWTPLEIREVLKRASAFILGPGSLLQDASSLRSLLYYLGLLRWAHRYQLKLYLIGQGIGPLRSPRSAHWVVQALQPARSILMRDAESFEWARSKRLERLMLGEDLALLLPIGREEPEVREEVGQRLRLGLALRPGLSAQNLEVLRRALEALAQRLSVSEIALLPFHPTPDEPVLRAVASKLPAALVTAQRPSDLLNVMRGLDLLIGMRLHSLVFSLLIGLPFCALSYDPKVEGFVKRVEEVCGQPLVWWRTSEKLDEVTLTGQIEQLYVQREQHAKRLIEARDVLRESARESLDRVIEQIVHDVGDI